MFGGQVGSPSDAIKKVGVTVSAKSAAATANNRVFFTVISFELELLRDSLSMGAGVHIYAHFFQFSESVTAMLKFRSAIEDLHDTTVGALDGCLSRLEYFGELRVRDSKERKSEKDGEYEHWGLTRVYGDLPAMKALAQTHRSLVSQILATPIRFLLEDIDTSSASAGIAPLTYMEKLQNPELNLLPPSPGPGSARHLNSVLQALSALAKSRTRSASRRAS
jgi:hypothetical protein